MKLISFIKEHTAVSIILLVCAIVALLFIVPSILSFFNPVVPIDEKLIQDYKDLILQNAVDKKKALDAMTPEEIKKTLTTDTQNRIDSIVNSAVNSVIEKLKNSKPTN
jgi:predicted PurR-regulated permease PerM